jgi:hypothetical protein
MKVPNKSIVNVTKFKYFGTVVTDKNCIHEEIKRRLNLRNAWYHSSGSCYLPFYYGKNVKIEIYKTITLPLVLYGRETCFLILEEEHRLRVRRKMGPKGI